MDKRAFKDSVYSEISSLIKSISNPHRIEIIDLLANGEKTVDQVAHETGISFANASQHLQLLKRMRLVQTRKAKNYVYYSIRNTYVYSIWKALREFSRYHIPEIDRMVNSFHHSRNVGIVSFKDLQQYEPYTLVDVRPKEEYDLHHIEGAIQIDASLVLSSLDQLDPDNTIITYCRGPFCTMADEVTEILGQNGFTVLRLEESALDV